MAMLVVCGACERHVKPGDARCPFCDAAVTRRPEPARAPRGLSRAKLHAFHSAALATGVVAVTLSASMGACGGTTSGGDASSDGQSQDTASNDGTSQDVAVDVGSGNDAQADGSAADSPSDVYHPDVIPLPYGCVFPSARGCATVTV